MVIRLGASADEVATQDELDALAADTAANYVPTARSVSTAAPLTGGGDLSANRTLGVTTGTTSGTVATGDHTHSGYAPSTRTISTTAPLTGGGDLSANRTLAITTGTTSGTVATGDHTHAYAPTTRSITAGTGLTGGGDLSTDRTLAVAYGTSGTTAAVGNDSRIVNAVQTTQRAPIGGVSTVTYAATITPDATAAVHFRIVATGALTLNVPTGGVDGQKILFEIQASGAQRVVTLASGYELGEAVTSRTVTIASGLWGYVGVTNRNGTYRLLAVDDGTA